MPIQQPYYLNAPTLADATAAYQDSSMTTCAADGLYSDGTIIRELVSCKFITTDYIPPCNPPCNPPMAISCGGTLDNNVYDMAINTGSSPADVGAIVIEFEVSAYFTTAIAGIEVDLNGVEYNELVSSTEGFLAADASYPTFIGVDDFGCVSTPSFTGEIFDWDSIAFIDSGFGLSYLIDSGFNQVQTTASNPGICKMIIPKFTATPEQVNVRVYIPCDQSICTVKVHCPTLLPSFLASVVFPIDPTAPPNPAFCPSPLDQKLYYAKVGNTNPTGLEYNDMIFKDPYGQVKADYGYYKIPDYITPGGLSDTMYVATHGLCDTFYDNCP